MLTNAEAIYLLNLPKKVEGSIGIMDELTITQQFPFKHEFKLVSPDDTDFEFFYKVEQSKKNQFKMTLYLMEEEAKIGLLRIDFNGKHQNPQTLNNNVPDFLHAYLGKWFDYNEHHIHFYVEGYKTSLDWAMPLKDDLFPVKEITNANDIVTAFSSFNQRIKLVTNFLVNPMMI
jgi:hypothetical protein